MSKGPLQNQMDEQRFLQGVNYVLQAARSIKKINTSELEHLNKILTDGDDESWRFEEAQVQIPTGKSHHFSLLSNPINKAREILGNAMQMAGNREPEKAALYMYCELILGHLFQDANRRTAVLATIWVLHSEGLIIDAQKFLDIPVGDLRVDSERKAYGEKFLSLLKEEE
ncbi:MAG: Fic family protein [Bdellovibrionales bacterium]